MAAQTTGYWITQYDSQQFLLSRNISTVQTGMNDPDRKISNHKKCGIKWTISQNFKTVRLKSYLVSINIKSDGGAQCSSTGIMLAVSIYMLVIIFSGTAAVSPFR